MTKNGFRNFFKRRDHDTIRKVLLNHPELTSAQKYASNRIKTSRYTALTFLPLNLFEQFHRFANLYFLTMIALQFIPQISTLNPITSMLPLLFVLSVTALKDGVDDIRRHKSDRKVNNRKVTIVRNGQQVVDKWKNIFVGDIVLLRKDDSIPADLVVLLTSERSGFCLIETAELDGETNLKVRQATDVLSRTFQSDASKLPYYKCEIHCEVPNNVLSKFEGVLYHGHLATTGEINHHHHQLIIANNKTPLSNDNILLRGCTLRATEWVYGLVVFAGPDTKLMKNSGTKHFKMTAIDVFLNKAVLAIVTMLVMCCFTCTLYNLAWERDIGWNFQIYQPWESFLPLDNLIGAFTIRALMTFPSYFILLNTFVPIALYVSVEVVRLAHSFLIIWDKKLWHAATDTPADVRNTSLSEQLGQIQYVFSDKTGTLTKNVMMLNKCSINGIKYGDVLDPATGNEIDPYSDKSADFSPLDLRSLITPEADDQFVFYDRRLVRGIHEHAENPSTVSSEMIRHYFRVMALCHTVVPSLVPAVAGDEGGATKLVYQGQSPDENALVSAARSFGYVLHERDAESLTIKECFTPGDQSATRQLTFPILHLLDFDAERKRMSVIVRDPNENDKIVMYCKGADSSLLPVAAPNQELVLAKTASHIHEFASKGLRTLVFGMRILSENEFFAWKRRCDEALTAVGDREEKVRAVYNEIENDFTILGSSAVEDKLQDGVFVAIRKLLTAGVRIWVLTGDMQETAVNVGYLSNLLHPTTKLVVINDEDASRPGKVAASLAQLHLEMEGEHYAPQEFTSLLGRLKAPLHNSSKSPPNEAKNAVVNNSAVFALAITGNALDTILPPPKTHRDNEFNKLSTSSSDQTTKLAELFANVAGRCSTVICCRMTPLAKARVVEFFRSHLHLRTCAIGDGANDVPMIRAADIGIGIAGREGFQAVLASDFSIAQFRFLAKLLLVHGRWSYFRMAIFITYFIYRSLTFTSVQFFFAFVCGGTGQTAFDTLFISLFNTVLLGLVIGATNKDISDDGSMAFPLLYEVGQKEQILNLRSFISTFIDSLYSAGCVFFVHYGTFCYYTAGNATATSVEMADLQVLSFTLGLTTLSLVALRCSLATYYWTFMNHISIWGSLLAYWLVIFALDPLIFAIFKVHTITEGAQYVALGWAPTWLASIGAIALATLPQLFLLSLNRCLRPTLTEAVRNHENNIKPSFFKQATATSKRFQPTNRGSQNNDEINQIESTYL